MLARDTRGRFFAASGSSVIVYDSTGKYVKAFGRPGGGPGEFGARVCCVVVGRGDTLHVFGSRRLHIFSPALEFVRSVSMAGEFYGWHGFVLSDGRVVVNTTIATATSAGLPLHLLGRDGQLIRSFGAERPASGGPVPIDLRPVAITPDQTGIWTSREGPYRFALWDLAGRKKVDLEVTEGPGVRTDSPFPGKGGNWPADLSHHDAAGRLWIHRRAPDPQYKGQPIRPVGRMGRIPANQFNLNRLIDPHDLVVDVIDTTTWTVLTSARFAEPGDHMLGTDLYYTRREDDLGVITFKVWRLRLIKDGFEK
jgi:hypothetical protein